MGLIGVIVVGYAFAYIAVKAAEALIDWDCRRKNTPEQREKTIQEMLQRIERERELGNTGCVSRTQDERLPYKD